ncbi:MAG: FAD-binding oxidoreductase [Promethearchaeota archaeon]|nr:MAG: FAD-binding oxidoreductase [Candidatus Lokiarchaeota archaeon]
MLNNLTKKINLRLIDIVGNENFVGDPEVLQSYSENPYLPLMAKKRKPDLIVFPSEVEEIVQIMKIANKFEVPVVPRSSGLDPYGDAIPIFGGIMIDLTKMNKIVDICPTALDGTFTRVEPGVTFNQLQKELKSVNMRVLLPARLTAETTPASTYFNRNILFSSAKHNYTVDWSILSYEMVLPTGEILRTGNLTLPESGGTMPHCHGSDIGRISMGSLGTTGILTKVTTKLKAEPEEKRIYFINSESLLEIIKSINSILRFSPIEIGEEHICLNNYCLASLISVDIKQFENNVEILPNWTHIISLTGTSGWVECQDNDLNDAIRDLSTKRKSELDGVSKISEEFDNEFSNPTRIDRAFNYLPFNRIEFYASSSQIPLFDKEVRILAEKMGYKRGLGTCLIPIEQGRSYYVEYDLYFDQSNLKEQKTVRKLYKDLYKYLITNGAFINTPHNFYVAELLYSKMVTYYENMNKVKKLLDPKGIMHPGKLFL